MVGLSRSDAFGVLATVAVGLGTGCDDGANLQVDPKVPDAYSEAFLPVCDPEIRAARLDCSEENLMDGDSTAIADAGKRLRACIDAQRATLERAHTDDRLANLTSCHGNTPSENLQVTCHTAGTGANQDGYTVAPRLHLTLSTPCY